MTQQPKHLAIISSMVAGILWGSWAFYTNKEASNVWWSTCAQFVSSFIVTAIMSAVILKTRTSFSTKTMQVLGPSAIASAIAIAMAVGLHVIVQTENIVPTITAPIMVGYAYSLFYAYKVAEH